MAQSTTEADAKPKKVPLFKWKPKENDILATFDGGIFIMKFENVFSDNQGVIYKYDRFLIKKASYEKQLPEITKYINYFLKFYDTDYELMLAYLKLKYEIDCKQRFTEETVGELIALIYEVLFTPTVVEKINQMVADNYFADIESSEESKKYSKQKKMFNESLEFTNKHIILLLRISFGMKIICPILFHFVHLQKIKIDKDSDLIYRFYKNLFHVFCDSENVDMYNKLFVYVKAKVIENKSHNKAMYAQRDILGVDEAIIINMFLQKVLISENMVKFKFTEKQDSQTKKFKENVIGFIKTIIKFQLSYFLKDQYSKNLTEVVSAKNADGLSGSDKMEMNLTKIDEGQTVYAEVDVEYEMNRIISNYSRFTVTDEEVDYYINNWHPCPIQITLIKAYWAKQFGSYRDMAMLTRKEFYTLALILKKKLLEQAGYDSEYEDGIAILPYLLTSNLSDEKTSTRIIRNNKYLEKVRSSYLYKSLITAKYSNLIKIKQNELDRILSIFINTSFTYVTYEKQEVTGQKIECGEDRISDEVLFFLREI